MATEAVQRTSSVALPLGSHRLDPGAGAGSAARTRASTPDRGGFHAIDQCAADPKAVGMVYVEGSPAGLAALARHVGRRARGLARPIVTAGGGSVADAWRDLAGRLGAGSISGPHDAAAAIQARAGSSILVILEGEPTRWGRTLAGELELLTSGNASRATSGNASPPTPTSGLLAFVLTARAPVVSDATVIELVPGLSPRETRQWCEAVAADGIESMAPPQESLESLEAWWAVARATPPTARPAPTVLSTAEARVFRRFSLAQRNLSAAEAALFDCDGGLGQLLARGVLLVDGSGELRPAPEAAASDTPDAEDAQAVARTLETIARGDPWALLRAAELYAGAGEMDRAEEAATTALLSVADATARDDFWSRYGQALSRQPGVDAGARWLRAAELALHCGDVDRALGFVHTATAGQGESYAAMWTLGRATGASGDLTTATIALEKALGLATDTVARAAAAAYLAEIRYQAGDFTEARRFAADAIAGGAGAVTRFVARNVLGKLHLAAAAWSEAEQHFAADACEAACVGERAAELRARLNRGIALLSWGRGDEARHVFLAMLDDGRREGNADAVAFALHNLAVEAHRRHDYGDALRWYDEAFQAAQRRAQKLPLANIIKALAELKANLGMVAEAEQTLAFGRRACGPGLPAVLVADFALVAARIHFVAGRTGDAAEALRATEGHMTCSHAGEKRGQCHRLAARVALEDGNLSLARQAITRAKEHASSIFALTEVAILEVRWARGAGEPSAEMAQRALEIAQQASSAELELEAHVLLALAHRDAKDTSRARRHTVAAAGLRDRMAAALPADIQARFLARRDFIELVRLDAMMGKSEASEPPPTLERPPLPRAKPSSAPEKMVGRDPAMVALRASIQRIATVEAAVVLIRGESGTGKELVAEALHSAGPRRSDPMIKVNCAALVESLLHSELFGHEEGAFTDATRRKRGRFEVAGDGTLFLDEIGDISPRTQTALLRVLQERTFERVGGTSPLRADCRIVCATHRDLKALVARGEFREDLYYRLEGVVLHVPPLRCRLDDLPLLAEAILERIASERNEPVKQLSPAALAALSQHPWPGNIRELENALRTASLFGESKILEIDDFTRNVDGLRALDQPPTSGLGESAEASAARETPQAVIQAAVPGSGRSGPVIGDLVTGAYDYVRAGASLRDLKRRMERDCIAMALAESRGNISRAADLLGMKRPRLSQLVKEFGIRTMAIQSEDTES